MGKTRSNQRETCPIVTLSTTNPTLTGLGSIPGSAMMGRQPTAWATA